MIKAKILILDFDGLLVDSAPECWLRCLEAFRMNVLYENARFSDIDKDLFLKMRYLVGPAHEFYFLMQSLFKYKRESDVQFFFNKMLNGKKNDALHFKKHFFKSRLSAQNKNMKSWIDSNVFFNSALEMAKRFAENNKLYIATMKDEKSVMELLQYKDIFCDESKILGNSYGDDKFSHLSYVINQNPSVNKNDFLFMDDNIKHIEEIKSLKIRSMLATWGYSSEASIDYAKKNQINTLDLNDCYKVVIDE